MERTSPLTGLIQHYAPRRVLACGTFAAELLAEYRTEREAVEVRLVASSKAVDIVGSAGGCDLVIVSGVLERLPKHDAQHLLVQWRDRLGAPVLVALPIGRQKGDQRSVWEMSDLLALGYYRAAAITRDEAAIEVYLYDVATYKTTPDWLNAQHWAHPELFDKYWW